MAHVNNVDGMTNKPPADLEETNVIDVVKYRGGQLAYTSTTECLDRVVTLSALQKRPQAAGWMLYLISTFLSHVG